jgi:hypothetical protein
MNNLIGLFFTLTDIIAYSLYVRQIFTVLSINYTIYSLQSIKPGMVIHCYNPGTQEAKAGGW